MQYQFKRYSLSDSSIFDSKLLSLVRVSAGSIVHRLVFIVDVDGFGAASQLV